MVAYELLTFEVFSSSTFPVWSHVSFEIRLLACHRFMFSSQRIIDDLFMHDLHECDYVAGKQTYYKDDNTN